MRAALILALLALVGCQRSTVNEGYAHAAEQAARSPAVSPQLHYLGLTPEACRLYTLGNDWGFHATFITVCPSYGGYSVAMATR